MNKKIILVGIIAAVGLSVFVFFDSKNKTNKENSKENFADKKTDLTALETLHDFGSISMKNGKVSYVFKILNSSKTDVNLKSVSTSCMCTSAYLESLNGEKGPFGMEGMGYTPPANENIPAGDSRDIKVEYDPNAHGPAGIGKINRFVYLTDSSGGKLQLEIKAEVTP